MTNVPLLDLKAQFAQIRAEVLSVIETGVKATVHPGRARAWSRVGNRAILRCIGRCGRLLWHRCAASGADGSQNRRRRRGDHLTVHLFRNGGHDRAPRRSPRVLRHRPRRFQSVGRRGAGLHRERVHGAGGRPREPGNRRTGSRDHAGASVWTSGRHAAARGTRAAPPIAPHRRCGAGHRHGGCRRGARGLDRRHRLLFFPSKNLGAFGDAGLCTTNDPGSPRLPVLAYSAGARIPNAGPNVSFQAVTQSLPQRWIQLGRTLFDNSSSRCASSSGLIGTRFIWKSLPPTQALEPMSHARPLAVSCSVDSQIASSSLRIPLRSVSCISSGS